MTRPAAPTVTIKDALMIIHVFSKPVIVFQYVNNSMRAGKARPSADRQRAPHNEINNSRFGMATANKTTN